MEQLHLSHTIGGNAYLENSLAISNLGFPFWLSW